MKTFLISIMLLATVYNTNAQTCKIKIYYDANGNRTQRILECGRQGDKSAIPMAAISKQNTFNDLATGTYQVYPNPAENKVNVKVDASLIEKGYSIFMTDISGKMIFQQKDVKQTISEIDLRGLADGTYFIQIVSGTDHHTVKIVKQTGNGYRY